MKYLIKYLMDILMLHHKNWGWRVTCVMSMAKPLSMCQWTAVTPGRKA
jgi:hypothetical protein